MPDLTRRSPTHAIIEAVEAVISSYPWPPQAERNVLYTGLRAWSRLRDDLDAAGREHFDRGEVPHRGDDGRWTSDWPRNRELRDPAAAWEHATHFISAWQCYLLAYDLEWPLDEPPSAEEREETGWLLTNEEKAEAHRREREAARAASTWPGIDAAEEARGRISAIGVDGRPWWHSRTDSELAWFLCRDGTTIGRHTLEDYEDIRHRLVLAEDESALRALEAGEIPAIGIGGRCKFFKPLDPYLEPWFPYLDAIGHPMPAQNEGRWEGMWHVLDAAHAELRAIREQEREECPEMVMHEEWAVRYEEVYDEELGALIDAPLGPWRTPHP